MGPGSGTHPPDHRQLSPLFLGHAFLGDVRFEEQSREENIKKGRGVQSQPPLIAPVSRETTGKGSF